MLTNWKSLMNTLIHKPYKDVSSLSGRIIAIQKVTLFCLTALSNHSPLASYAVAKKQKRDLGCLGEGWRRMTSNRSFLTPFLGHLFKLKELST